MIHIDQLFWRPFTFAGESNYNYKRKQVVSGLEVIARVNSRTRGINHEGGWGGGREMNVYGAEQGQDSM